MFTGLVETTGTLLSVERGTTAARLCVAAPTLAGRWGEGDSIAVNGVCLTALYVEDANEKHPGRFAADLAAETVSRTTLANLEPGSLVNLELPRQAGLPLGGHIVQGHVDGVATLVSLTALHSDLATTDWRMTLALSETLRQHVVPQGSITVDGISLTVARVDDSVHPAQIEIAVIPHTYRSTNLRTLLAGSLVNIETDVLSKYAQQQMAAASPEVVANSPAQPVVAQTADTEGSFLTADYLIANGY